MILRLHAATARRSAALLATAAAASRYDPLTRPLPSAGLPRRLHDARGSDHGSKPGGPLARYRGLVSQGKLQHDTYQENVASELDSLLRRLEQYEMEMEDYHTKLSTWDSTREKERRRLLVEEAEDKQHDGVWIDEKKGFIDKLISRLGMASSDPDPMPKDPMPKKKMPATVDEGVEFPRCWCGDLCKAKTADDPFSYLKGRRFFMCANYAHDPAPKRDVYDQPPSPPPLCSYYEWIDNEQPAWAKYDIEYDHKVVWEKSHAATRREEAAEKMKLWREEQRKKKEEKEREKKELREAERERKRERARRAQEDVADGKGKGKWPRWTQ